MRTIIQLTIAVVALSALAACDQIESNASANERSQAPIAELSADEVSKLLERTPPPHVLDVNTDGVRAKYGLLPGAVRVPSIRDVLTVLPRDKAAQLVFYCANSWCGASHNAAERAVAAGYTAVHVMPEGIQGWVDAGRPTLKTP